jgi:pyruvate kinase
MFLNPEIDGARYNVGIRTSYSPIEALKIVKDVAKKYNKVLWIDLKGRQLRITKWADPCYGEIELNHQIECELPAKVIFRGNDWSNIVAVKGNKIFIDPDPKNALGSGQAINIVGNFQITDGFLTVEDKEYIKAAKELDIHNYMLSFVEEESDMESVLSLDSNASMILKIESQKGLSYVSTKYVKSNNVGLMAARDDLFINIGENKSDMLNALKLIIERDNEAILASHIYTSLVNPGFVSMADISDVQLMKNMGFKNFMFSDSVSHKCFEEAVTLWKNQSE